MNIYLPALGKIDEGRVSSFFALGAVFGMSSESVVLEGVELSHRQASFGYAEGVYRYRNRSLRCTENGICARCDPENDAAAPHRCRDQITPFGSVDLSTRAPRKIVEGCRNAII